MIVVKDANTCIFVCVSMLIFECKMKCFIKAIIIQFGCFNLSPMINNVLNLTILL